MEYFEVIEKRFSCRSFTDEKIKKEELDKLLLAAKLSPTACNFQPQRIVVIEDSNVLEKLKLATKYTFSAKTILAICHDTNVSWHRGIDGLDYGLVDASIVATEISLAATSLGLGTCFVCAMNPSAAKEVLELPDNYQVDILLPVGYPKEIRAHNTRKELEEIVIYK